MKNKDVIWHEGYVTRSEKNLLNKHKSGLIWFTGLSASGKSTIAHRVERALYDQGVLTYVLDGDNVRHGINSNLGFSPKDRDENIRRIVELSKLFVDAGILVLACFISPYREVRENIRRQFEEGDFLEIYVKCSISECEKRDPKGQYKKARAGIIKNYTGISSPYEEPGDPDLVIETDRTDIAGAVRSVMDLLNERKFLLLD